jgi:hypothetical protein
MNLSVAQDDHPYYIECQDRRFEITLTVRFFYPSTPRKTGVRSLLVLLLSIYVTLSKNSFFMPRGELSSFSGCKGTLFPRTAKTFPQKNII